MSGQFPTPGSDHTYIDNTGLDWSSDFKMPFKMGRCTVPHIRDLSVLLFMVAAFSTILTYHIGLYLPYPSDGRSFNSAVNSYAKVNYGQFEEKIYRNEKRQPEKSRDWISTKDTYHGHEELEYTNSGKLHVLDSRAKGQLHFKSGNILAKITKLEDRLLSTSHKPAIILNKGGKDNSTKVLEELLKHSNYKVHYKKDLEPINHFSIIWDLRKDGAISANISKFQKVNKIPALQYVTADPSYLCQIQDVVNAFSNDKISGRVKCFHQHDTLNLNTVQPHKDSVWVFRQRGGSLTFHQQLPDNRTLHTSLWHVPSGTLNIGNYPFFLRLSVIVTSFLPLRVYMRSNCEVYSVIQDYMILRKDLTSLWHVRQVIQEGHPQRAAHTWWEKLQQGIVTSLLTAEHIVWLSRYNGLDPCRCPRCFQALTIEVFFTNQFQPVISKVEQEDLSNYDKESWEDIVSLTTSHEMVAPFVAIAIENQKSLQQFGVMDCNVLSGLCLQDSDVVNILDTRQESLAPVNYLRIYPTAEKSYDILIEYFRHLAVSLSRGNLNKIKISSKLPVTSSCRPSIDLHYVVSAIEGAYQTADPKGRQLHYNINRKPMFISRKLDAEVSLDSTDTDYQEVLQNSCSTAALDLPYLQGIQIQPSSIHLTPKFNPTRLSYTAKAAYQTLVFSITAVPKHCQAQSRFHSITGNIRSTNYTLGVGENTIRVYIMDKNRAESVNMYTVIIYREENGIAQFRPSLRVCVLKQDCTLKFASTEACGLRMVNRFRSWRIYERQRETLPSCSSVDYREASWYVPCESCDKPSSCHWKSAQWQSSFCKSKHLNDSDIRECFKGKSVLFIGDSTNRGIFHYILEKINGSLWDSDRTHTLRIFNGLNDKWTDLSFSYYPQFWLPNNHRPTFDKAVFQLIKWMKPLKNNSSTVLVVGGVHWLDTHHLQHIKKALHRENLSNIRVIIKGLGAGFHQQVDGIHHNTQSVLEKLSQRENELAMFSRKLGFQVVETFNMTMARYKDFLQGKCACHFHTIQEIKNSTLDIPTYHVHGEINAAYSQIVINNICDTK